MTETEQMLWQRLRANRLGGFHFRRQQVIAGFIVDFYCHAASLVVELDGPVHEKQTSYDQERDRVLAALGMHVLRIQNDEIRRNLETVLNRIQQICEAATSKILSIIPSTEADGQNPLPLSSGKKGNGC